MAINIYFLVGLGATAELYQPFLNNLTNAIPNTTLQIIEWWKTDQHDISSNAILIGHSGGGIMALRLLEQWPQRVKRIIMLDSHQIHHVSKIPSVTDLLTVTLANSDPHIKAQVEKVYAPLLQDSTTFHLAFSETVDWVNSYFDKVCKIIPQLPKHSVYHIGFTDNNYKKYSDNAVDIEKKLWGNYGIDVLSMPMNHFDLISPDMAKPLTQNIADWLKLI